MARPRVFISSTFYNLKEVRSALEEFVRGMGYDAIVTDNITYLPGQPIDESCYLEAGSCDIFVLIIGGRYGSEVSETDTDEEKAFYDQYKSITRKEFESALERDVPIYVAVDRAVQIEYGTWDVNRDNESVNYRHVDSVNVFRLVEFIRNKTQTPVHEFEQSAEILEWLREQWSGLFQKMLTQRSEQKRLASLEAQVGELREVSTTFKRYLEVMLQSTGKKDASEVIAEEDARLAEQKLRSALRSIESFQDLEEELDNYDATVELFRKASSLEDFSRRLKKVLGDKVTVDLVEHWQKKPRYIREINDIRSSLGLPDLNWESTEGSS